MRILTCVVTHNRWAYTRRCLKSLRDTTRPGDKVVIVDNASTDGTIDSLFWFKSIAPRGAQVMVNDENIFPGAATNKGWTHMLEYESFDLLHRSDNDIEYLPGWQDEVEEAYERYPDLALLGVLNQHEDRGVQPEGESGDVERLGHVGGNVVMPRRLWDDGLRWDETPWGRRAGEDAQMSADALKHGTVAQLRNTVAHNMAYGRYSDYPAYYDVTARLRGIADAEHSV